VNFFDAGNPTLTGDMTATIVAGSGATGITDGTGTAAKFNTPQGALREKPVFFLAHAWRVSRCARKQRVPPL
jgi:hypothetical protein